MKPNDENGKLPTAERPLRVLIIKARSCASRSETRAILRGCAVMIGS